MATCATSNQQPATSNQQPATSNQRNQQLAILLLRAYTRAQARMCKKILLRAAARTGWDDDLNFSCKSSLVLIV